MKEYKMVYLNEKISFSTKKDIQQAETTLNLWVKDGWELVQIFPYSIIGSVVAVMCRER